MAHCTAHTIDWVSGDSSHPLLPDTEGHLYFVLHHKQLKQNFTPDALPDATTVISEWASLWSLKTSHKAARIHTVIGCAPSLWRKHLITRQRYYTVIGCAPSLWCKHQIARQQWMSLTSYPGHNVIPRTCELRSENQTSPVVP
jgi:hypothetical protein